MSLEQVYILALEDEYHSLKAENESLKRDIQAYQVMVGKMESAYLQMRLLDTLPNEHIQWLLQIRSQGIVKLSKLLEDIL